MPLPGDLTTITVTGTFTTITGTPLTGQVNFSLTTPVEDATGKVIFNAFTQSVSLNSAGYMSVVLPCTDNADLNPANFSYLVTEAIQGLGRAYYVQLPHTLGSTVDLSQLAPVATPPAASAFATTNTWTAKQIYSGNPPLQITTGAAAGDVLTSDASGNTSWQPAQSALPVIVVAAPTGNATTDSASIRAAFATAAAGGGARVILQATGIAYKGDTGQFAIPDNTTLFFPRAAMLNINCTGGASVDAITIGNGSSIEGETYGSNSGSVLMGTMGNINDSSSVNARTLISNVNHELQEYCYIRGLGINGTGGTYAVAIVEFMGVFVNSFIRDIVVGLNPNKNAGMPGIRISGGTTSASMGPLTLDNITLGHGPGDTILITDNGQPGGTASIWLDHIEADHPANGYHSIHLSGTAAGLSNILISDLHCENNTAVSPGPSACVYVDGVNNLLINGMEALTTNATNKVCVWITNNSNNNKVKVQNLRNLNGMNPAIQDNSWSGGGLSMGGSGYFFDVYEFNGANWAGFHWGSMVLANDLVLSSQPGLPLQQTQLPLASTAVDPRHGIIVVVAPLAASVTVAAPLNPIPNQILIYQFVQNGTGGYAVSWNGIFRVAAGVVSTSANLISVVAFRYDYTIPAWVQYWATTGV